MSHILWDEDEWETVHTSRPCSCAGKCDGRCNGMASFGLRRRDPIDVLRIKADRKRAQEDEILRQADEIRARRKEGA